MFLKIYCFYCYPLLAAPLALALALRAGQGRASGAASSLGWSAKVALN
jgi:hypothetical protein